ncbi:MAG: DUF493 domain-containing protein [Calditrichia bacterium]
MQVDIKWFDDNLHLRYPCEWVYKIIGKDARRLHDAVADIIPGNEYTVKFSNFSSGGKYICLNVEMTVDNESQRNDIFHSLKQHDHISMVL